MHTLPTLSGCLPVQQPMPVHVQILDAITFLHESGFCHRDIKPGEAQ
jgi:serine/threonine protein kinase